MGVGTETAVGTDNAATHKQLSLLVWSYIPQDHWPLLMTSSVAYSCCTKDLCGAALKGGQLLELPLWHSAVFTRVVKSQVREIRERPFCSPKLVRRGVHTLRDFLTLVGQMKVHLIPSLPRSI